MVGSIAAIAALFARQFIPGARGQLLVNIRVTSGIESRLDTQPPLTQIIAFFVKIRRNYLQGLDMLILISPAKTLDYQSPLATTRYTQPELLEYSQQLIGR